MNILYTEDTAAVRESLNCQRERQRCEFRRRGMACQSAPNQSEANPQDVDTTALQSQGAAEASPNASATAAVKKQEGAVKYAKPAPPAHKKYTLPAETHVPVRLIDTI